MQSTIRSTQRGDRDTLLQADDALSTSIADANDTRDCHAHAHSLSLAHHHPNPLQEPDGHTSPSHDGRVLG